MNEEAEISFRPLTSEDLRFIHDSWGSSIYKGTQIYKHLTPGEFHSFHRPARERFFQKASSTVMIACPTVDPWLIAGWIAVEQIPTGIILHYIYVKSTFKGHHIATKLIQNVIKTEPIFFTAMTEQASKIIAKHSSFFRKYIYVPELT